AKSGGASSGTSLAKSTNTSVLKSRSQQPRKALDQHRSINAVAETFFKSLKAELIWRQSWQTRRQAEAAIFQYINGFYNTRRRHSYLGAISPLAFEAKVA
ncbi:IS3 family transposase, partial [Sphingobium mellinum]|uniref:IS3 family transposase n=1 Tax=Sphingobium mellinum TaxID=1387166 RepID=UPI0030EE8B3D